MHIFAGTLARRPRALRRGLCAALAGALVALGGCGRIADGWYRMRGDAMRHAEKHAEALSWYQRIASNRQDAAVLHAMAVSYAAHGDTASLHAVSARICAEITDMDHLRALAQLRVEYDDHSGAAAVLERMALLASNKWQHHAALIATLADSGATNAAAAALERAEAWLAPTTRNRERIAGAWLWLGDASNALARYEQMVTDDSADHGVRLGLAALQVREKQYAAAVTNLRLLAAAQPDDATVLQLLADALNESGHPHEALPWYRKAIRVDQRNALALNNLAYVLLLHTSNVAEALELARSSVAIERTPYALDTLAYAQYLRGADDVALRHLREAEQLLADEGKETDPEMHLHFGLVHARRGEMEYAVTRFRMALAGQPELEEQIKKHAWYREIKRALQRKDDT